MAPSMQHFAHSKTNRVLGAGGNPNTDPLAIRDEVDDGVRYVISYWRPSREELFLLNNGGSVALSIMGGTMPPAYVGVEPDS